MRKKNKVVLTQHVNKINTLSELQNAQLHRAMVDEDKDVAVSDSRPAITTNTSSFNNIGARKK